MGFTDALRGYALPIHQRDAFKCTYCGLDGTQSFQNWLSLTQDHLLPESDPRRNSHEFIVTACQFCNVSDNRYFEKEQHNGTDFSQINAAQLLEKKRVGILKTRAAYLDFWTKNVKDWQRGHA
jgi:5-methylcytosine-specific restriction endonuclease McrA